jgi:hypothetical protein
VDGGQDLGIDAIAFNDREKKCWLFQAKFQHSGQGLMAWSELSKFFDGFDALASDSFEGANPKILAMEDDIRSAATEPGWRFELVLVSTSAKPLSSESIETIHERLAYQDPGNSGMFKFKPWTLNDVTTSIEQSLDAAKINLEVELHDWGCLSDPCIAYYGQVSLGAVTKWREHGTVLFAKNLRSFIPSSPVADSITRTLVSQSELFWYLNNGATILCERIERSGPYSQQKSRERGHFKCIGVSVVNGAQTIGTIWDEPSGGADLDPRGMLFVRLISLENAPTDFAQHVTKATNTQNNILPRDFATLDAAQRRLAREFTLEGRTYVFRQGDPTPRPEDGCDIEELSLALACSTSIELTTIAYRNPGYLIDPDSPSYKAIFGIPGRPLAEDAWRLVRIMRASNLSLSMIRGEGPGRRRQVATHAARQIQHRVMNDPKVKSLRGQQTIEDKDLHTVVCQATVTSFDAINSYLALNHQEREYLQVIFKNTVKIKKMHAALDKMTGAATATSVPDDLFAGAPDSP